MLMRYYQDIHFLSPFLIPVYGDARPVLEIPTNSIMDACYNACFTLARDFNELALNWLLVGSYNDDMLFAVFKVVGVKLLFHRSVSFRSGLKLNTDRAKHVPIISSMISNGVT